MAENWIIPCNIRFFDITEHFSKQTCVVWKNSFTIKKGDTAYIYIGSPVGEIRYKCIVVADHVDEETLQRNSYAIPAKKSNNYFSKKIKYIELELVKQYPDGTFTLEHLREHGLGQVQIQARTSRMLQSYITEIDNQLNDNT